MARRGLVLAAVWLFAAAQASDNLYPDNPERTCTKVREHDPVCATPESGPSGMMCCANSMCRDSPAAEDCATKECAGKDAVCAIPGLAAIVGAGLAIVLLCCLCCCSYWAGLVYYLASTFLCGPSAIRASNVHSRYQWGVFFIVYHGLLCLGLPLWSLIATAGDDSDDGGSNDAAGELWGVIAIQLAIVGLLVLACQKHAKARLALSLGQPLMTGVQVQQQGMPAPYYEPPGPGQVYAPAGPQQPFQQHQQFQQQQQPAPFKAL